MIMLRGQARPLLMEGIRSLGSLMASCFFSPITNRPSIWRECSAASLGYECVKMNDQGLENSDQGDKLARAPAALRILGGAALAWGGFMGLGLITGIVITQAPPGDAGTLADWTATVALVVVGRGLLRSRWWAGLGAWVTSLGLIVFGVYWAIWGFGNGPTDPIANPRTGAGFPWPAFVVPGVVIAAMLLPKSSRAWIRQTRRARKAANR
jgi:hypothetical protein